MSFDRNTQSSVFRFGVGMALTCAIMAGVLQWVKYDLMGASLSYIPAIMSNSNATIPPAMGFIMAVVIDFLQKAVWNGINITNGMSRKEMFLLIVVFGLIALEVLAVASPIIVPDISGISMGQLPQIFWERILYGIFSWSFFHTLGALVFIVSLTVLPEFLLEEASRHLGETWAWLIFFVGILIARVVYSAYTGATVIPQINWF